LAENLLSDVPNTSRVRPAIIVMLSFTALSPVRPLRNNGVPHRGVKTVRPLDHSCRTGIFVPTWMQAPDQCAQVRKGEKPTLIVYVTTMEKQRIKNDLV
jgi:antirestriction protein ArdC